jgi:hypothetical protein
MNKIVNIINEEIYNAKNEIYYHGSNNKFDEFGLNNNKAHREFDIPVWYFTKDLNYAKTYGKYIYSAKLNIRNTFNTEIDNHYDLFIEYLKEERKSDDEIEEILDVDFYKGLPYWTCQDAYYAAISNGFDSILIQEVLEGEILSIGVFNLNDIQIIKISEL